MVEIHRPDFGYPANKSLAREQGEMFFAAQNVAVDFESRHDPEFVQTRKRLETEQGIVLYNYQDATDIALLMAIANRDDIKIMPPVWQDAKKVFGAERFIEAEGTTPRVILNRFDSNVLAGHISAMNPSNAEFLGAAMRHLRLLDLVYVINAKKDQGKFTVRERLTVGGDWQDILTNIGSGEKGAPPKNDTERGLLVQRHIAEMF